MTKTLKAALATAIAASAMLATPTLAHSNTETHSIAVRYSDLDLSTERGTSALERRMVRAAEQICGIDKRTSGRALPTAASRRCLAEIVTGFDHRIAALAAANRRA